MMLYAQLLEELNSLKEPSYAAFQSRLLGKGSFNVLGVRMPVLRKLAKKYLPHIAELLRFPDEYYEVRFIKLLCASLLDFEEFIKVVDYCVSIIDNWALCDSFAPKCIAAHRDSFLPYIERFYSEGSEFYQRFALTTLLHFYVEDNYLDIIFDKITNAGNQKFYYVHMASAWLLAEVLAKNYERGVAFLLSGKLDKRTRGKAICKACESFRITDERKKYLKSIKR